MSGATTRLPLIRARGLAWEAAQLLADTCERVVVAGSIRRQRPDVGDLELVLLPLYGEAPTDLFGPATGPRPNLLDARCDRLFEQGVFGKRYDKHGRPRWGSGLKWATFKNVPLDIFPVVAPAQFGVDLAIRTGSAQWAQRLVTPVEHGGWCPKGHFFNRGALWRHGEMLDTPDEAALFDQIGRAFVPPEQREVR